MENGNWPPRNHADQSLHLQTIHKTNRTGISADPHSTIPFISHGQGHLKFKVNVSFEVQGRGIICH